MKNFFKKVSKLISVFFGKSMKEGRKWSPIAVNVVEAIKEVSKNPAMDFVVALTTFTQLDDQGLAFVRKHIDSVSLKLGIIHGILQEEESDADAIARILDYIRKMHPDAQPEFLLRLGAELNIAFADKKISLTESIFLMQLAYGELKERLGR